MLDEAVQALVYLLDVLVRIFGVNKDVIEVNDNTNVQHILEDVVHKALKRSRRVCQAVVHYLEFVRTISCMKGGFPFVALGNVHEVVGPVEIDLRINVGGSKSIEQVQDEWKGILISLGDTVEPSVIDCEAKRAIFLRIGAPDDDWEGRMKWLVRFSFKIRAGPTAQPQRGSRLARVEELFLLRFRSCGRKNDGEAEVAPFCLLSAQIRS